MTTEQINKPEVKKDKSNVQTMNFEVYTPVSTQEGVDRNGWLTYGADNDFPAYLIDLKNSSPVHGALCKSIGDMIAGKGLGGPDGLDLAPLLPAISSDLKTQGGFYLEVIRSVEGTEITRVNHLPFMACRLAVDKATNYVTGLFYSRDWHDTTKKANKPIFIPLFKEREKEQSRGCIIVAEPTDGLDKYPKPDYWSAINHIETARQMALYNVNSFLNGLFPSFIINFRNGIPEPDQKAQILREWERSLSGAKNTGKFIATFNEAGTDTSPLVEAFPMTEANTTYLELAHRQSLEGIFIGHRVTTPRIFGIAESGNGLSSNTDEMKVGFALFNAHMIEPKQRMIENSFNRIQRFNKMGEVKIIPNSPLDLITPAQAVAQTEAKPQQFSEVKDDLDEFIALGSDGVDGYILIDSFETDTEHDDDHDAELKMKLNFVSTGTARPNAGSEQDKEIDNKLFITRYRYKGELRDNTRKFCRTMLSADKLYRKEDIVAMENKAVNPGWGPNGVNNYSIWFYKGGGACHHYWQKEVYVSAEGLGIDVNNPNAQTIAVRKAEAQGYKIRNEKLVAQLPIDMPYEGFLPDNKRR